MSSAVSRYADSSQASRSATQVRVTPMVNYISASRLPPALHAGGRDHDGLARPYPLYAGLFAILWIFLDIMICSSIRLAAQWEKAVVFRLGRFHNMKGPGLFMVVPSDRSDPDGGHPRPGGEHPQATGHHARQCPRDDRRGPVLPREQRGRGHHHGPGFPIRDLAVCPDLAPRRDRPDEPRPAPHRARGDRQVDRAARREGHQGLGPGSHRPADPGRRHARGAQEDDVAASLGRAGEAGDDHQGRGRPEAASNLAAAARTMAESPGAMQLRTLQSIDGLGPSASNTVVLAVPVEMFEGLNAFRDLVRSRIAHAAPDGARI